ncbi:MAG: MFS transporter, partial [Anaerolineae bacterium]|nr:MFS transporter [Anaerolineae bacterium]
FGAIPFGVSFALLWVIPATSSQIVLFLFYTGVYIFYEAAFTAVSCPYSALTPELTDDHDERTSLVTYRMAVSIGAGLAAPLLLGLVIFPMFPARDPRSYQTIGIASGLAFIPPVLITFLGTRERKEFQVEAPLPLKQSLGFIRRNSAFRSTVALRLLSWTPVVIVQAVFAYYLAYWTGMTEDETSMVQGLILAVAFLFLPLVSYLSHRLEKRQAYTISMASWAVVMLSIFLVPQGAKAPVYVLGALAGFGVSAAHVIPSAMTPDVMEVDELMSGRRQEGVYAGIMTFIDKLARMAALAVLPLALRWAHYVQPTAVDPMPSQPVSALMALRISVSVVPALLLIVSIPVARAYPLTRQRYEEIRQALATRRAHEKLQAASDG